MQVQSEIDSKAPSSPVVPQAEAPEGSSSLPALDIEFRALEACVYELSCLPEEARPRVLIYLLGRFGLHK